MDENETNGGDTDPDTPDKEEVQDEKPVKDVKPRAPNYIWKYFEKVMPFDDKMAKCRSCHKKLSYKSTVSNLKVHMAIKHYEVIKYDANFANKDYLFRKGEPYEKKISTRDKKKMFEMLEMESDNDDVQNDTTDGLGTDTGNVKFSSEIWRHFDVEDDEAICGLCRESVTGSLEDMKNHLEEKHSNVLDDIAQKVLDAASEDEVLEDDTYTEVVYLEDEPKKSVEQPEKRKKKSKQKPKVKVERHASTSSDEIIQKPKRKKYLHETNTESDELKVFLNYVTVLLKKVPEESSQKLHLDIINLIMNATKPQNKIVIETVNFDNASANNATILDKSIMLSQNGANSDVNTQKILTVPIQNLMSQNIDKNNLRHVTSNTNSINTRDSSPRTISVSRNSIVMPDIRVFSNS